MPLDTERIFNQKVVVRLLKLSQLEQKNYVRL